jgi:hypothetical protein
MLSASPHRNYDQLVTASRGCVGCNDCRSPVSVSSGGAICVPGDGEEYTELCILTQFFL